MALIREAPVLLGDTGPFCRFAETKALGCLQDYLASNLVIVREVEVELRFRSTQPQHRELAPFAKDEPPFVAFEAIDLERGDVAPGHHPGRALARPRGGSWQRAARRAGQLRRDRNRLRSRRARCSGAHGRRRGQGACAGPSHTTEDLLAEMVAASVMKAKLAVLVYSKVYGSDRDAFDAAVADARARGA
jgi:hypothetical protein